ncbi:hypothetical protein SAMN04488503_0172 [Humidesulfovibrio mexicanus]|uniref:Uncharacterized protein n=1 Tax=Humidesulfovibrio mexicanus TaxID=147047 RepID=A0A239D963_9BACT|nr:hypothetical protein [Humidesulfovibrio mexicanus]SNS28885.1 hypothetical protein SAMN04488503_0172 [Humidesulfovibrio mexicanus]
MKTYHNIVLLLAVLTLSACGVVRNSNSHTPIRRMGEAEMFAGNPQAQALAEAAVKGNIKEIDRLIDAGADPNAVGLYGMTVPGWLLYHPNKAGFRRLLERGADPNKIWYNETSPQTSLLHEATYMSPTFGTDYLKMCLEVGKGNPNLLPPDKHYRPINLAVNAMCHDAFIILYNAGADLDFHSDTAIGRYTLVQAAAQSGNFELTYFLLQRGADYTYVGKTGIRSLKDVFDYNFKYTGKSATDSRDPQYMWFWRCVDFLEKRGMTFNIMSAKDKDYAVRPAVLDTTPVDYLRKAHQP